MSLQYYKNYTKYHLSFYKMHFKIKNIKFKVSFVDSLQSRIDQGHNFLMNLFSRCTCVSIDDARA